MIHSKETFRQLQETEAPKDELIAFYEAVEKQRAEAPAITHTAVASTKSGAILNLHKIQKTIAAAENILQQVIKDLPKMPLESARCLQGYWLDFVAHSALDNKAELMKQLRDAMTQPFAIAAQIVRADRESRLSNMYHTGGVEGLNRNPGMPENGGL